MIHRLKHSCVLLKINIAKAFDLVFWEFLLDLLQHMGFGSRWRDWIATILSIAITKIMLNGKPRRRICHARGLRQGDPLSPLLFVLVMEVLNHLLAFIERDGFLSPVRGIGSAQVSLYAEDLVLFVAPLEHDVQAVKATLSIFGQALGLFSNLEKAWPHPSTDLPTSSCLSNSYCPARSRNSPYRYLGIPLSVYKLKRSDEQPIIDKVASRILGWKG